MTCPVCGFENLQGDDSCENCGADLRTIDIPQPSTAFEVRLVAESLSELDPRRPISLPMDAPAAEAIRTMQERRIGCVLVTDAERLVGIFTERDALLKLAGRPLEGVRLAAVMTRDPVVLRAEDNVAVAIHKMAVGGFRHIPLVDGERATGIVSARDLFRHVIHVLGEPAVVAGASAEALAGAAEAGWPFATPDPTQADGGDGRPVQHAPTSGSGGPG